MFNLYKNSRVKVTGFGLMVGNVRDYLLPMHTTLLSCCLATSKWGQESSPQFSLFSLLMNLSFSLFIVWYIKCQKNSKNADTSLRESSYIFLCPLNSKTKQKICSLQSY